MEHLLVGAAHLRRSGAMPGGCAEVRKIGMQLLVNDLQPWTRYW